MIRSMTHHQKYISILLILLFFPKLYLFSEVYNLGGMYTYHYHDGRYADWGDYAREGAFIAIDEINRKRFLGSDNYLQLLPENTIDYHCWPSNAAEMAKTLFEKNILILTGADCSSPAVEIAKVASDYKIPVISNGANASSLSSKNDYPWFIRVVTPSEEYDRYLVELADNLGVKEVAYFYTTDAWGLGARKVINETTKIKNISIKREFGFKRDTSQAVIDKFVYEVAKEEIKNIIITGPTPDTVRVFKAINKFGLNKKGNTIFATEMISADESIEAVNGSKGYFAPMTLLENSKILESFKLKLEGKIKKDIDVNSKAFFYGALSYDHIYTVAHAINNMNKSNTPVTSETLMSFLRKVDFIGATGRVYFSQNTNDRINMPLQIMNSHGYDAESNTVKFKSIAKVSSDGRLIINKSKIIMPGYD